MVPSEGVVLNLRHLYFDIVSDFVLRISCLCKVLSTPVENVRQIAPFFYKTNPIFADFEPKTKISPKNKPNTNPILAKSAIEVAR